MEKVLISLPADLSRRLKTEIPARQRSQFISKLVEQALTKIEEKKEKRLYKCALAVQKDSALNQEMSEWDTTLNDGLDDESW